MLRYYDVNINAGGPVKKDKAWWFFSWRKQFNSVDQPLFNFDSEFDTWNTNPSAKGTYQINQNHKLVGYYQWNMKIQPTRLPQGDLYLRQHRPDDDGRSRRAGCGRANGTAR